MNSRLRPSLSESRHEEERTEDLGREGDRVRGDEPGGRGRARPRTSFVVSLSATALATVISGASQIQATPRAMTMRVWKGDQGERSMRAGMRLRIAPGAGASLVVVIDRLRAGLAGVTCRCPLPRVTAGQSFRLPIRYPIGELPARRSTFRCRRPPSAGCPAHGGHHTPRRIERATSWACSDHASARPPGASERGPVPRPAPASTLSAAHRSSRPTGRPRAAPAP